MFVTMSGANPSKSTGPDQIQMFGPGFGQSQARLEKNAQDKIRAMKKLTEPDPAV